MDWAQQTDDLMKSWTDAQKQLWSGWMSWVQQMPQTGSGGAMFDPGEWMKMAADTWSSSREGTAERLAGNLFGMPDIMMRSMSLLMKSWQVVAPQLEKGKPWQPDLEKLLEQWRQEMIGLPQRQAATAGEFADLTKTLFERWSPMTGPWLAMVGQAMAAGHPGAAFLGGTSGMSRAMGFEEGVAPILMGLGEMPRGTVVREKMGSMLKAVDAFTDLRSAQGEYHAAIANALTKAVEKTMEHLAKLAKEGEKISSVRDLMRVWFMNADRTLNEIFTSPDFANVRDKMTNAMMAYKVRRREALEVVYSAMEIPTRNEIDEAHLDIHNLKKEVRMLRKELKVLNTRLAESMQAGGGKESSGAASKSRKTAPATDK